MSKDIRKENSKQRNKIPFLILSIVLVVVLVVVIGLAIKNRDNSTKVLHTDTQSGFDSVEKWQEGVITHDGKNYVYNKNIKVYLLMGIDSDEPAKSTTNYIEGGQSDAMFLLVTDAQEKSISVVSINRNTMTRIEQCYDTGASAGYITAQICLQHGYGDGMNLSAQKATNAVSYLFYNLPINGYLTIRMGALPMMNDAVGGVEVTVLDDLVYESKGVNLKTGETVTLTGEEAYIYLRGRDIDTFDSASNRLRRQEQYIAAYMEKLKAVVGSDTSAAIDIYESIDEYIVSTIDFASLVNEVKDYTYTSDNLYTVPGETIMGEVYEEYHVDEEALYDMILEVFYTELTE